MDNRYEIAEQNGMSREFADWFFDNKKAGCGNVWFMMMAAMWEGWQGRAAMLQGADGTLTNEGTIPASTPCKEAPEHIWLQTAGVWPENGEFSELTWCSDNQHEDDTLYVRADVVSGNSPVIPDCSCRTCRPVTFADSRFVVCPECGNKRCPHANDHRNACTGSNELGQEGSAYQAALQQEVIQALAKGMERYGDGMQKLADGGD